MDYHQNARLTVHSRERMARKVLAEGCTLKLAAASFNVSAKTAAKWVRRYRASGVADLRDRSSRPHRLYRPTAEAQVQRVGVLRRQRWTGYRIAQTTGLSRATVSRILRRLQLNRIRDLDPAPAIQRYEQPPRTEIDCLVSYRGTRQHVRSFHGEFLRNTLKFFSIP